MGFTRQKSRAGANPESPARTQPGTNIREECNPRRTVFKQEHNGLLIEWFVQYSQEDKGDELRYLFLGLNESSTDDNTKNFYFSMDCSFKPDKNEHSQCPDVMQLITKAKE